MGDVCDHGAVAITHEATTDDRSESYLIGRLDLVADRVNALLGPALDPGQLALEMERCDRALDALESEGEAIQADGETLTARRVAASFGLSTAMLDVVLLAVLVDLDADVRALIASRHGDQGKAWIELALRLVDAPIDHRSATEMFGEDSPLVRHHLIAVEGFDRPLTDRPYTVPDRVARGLWGVDRVDPLLRNLQASLVAVASPTSQRVAEAVRAGVRAVYIRERGGVSGRAFAAAVIEDLDVPAVAFDLSRRSPDQTRYGLAAAAAREGGLRDAAVVVGPIDDLVDDPESLRPLLQAPWPVLITGSVAWDPRWSSMVPFVVDAPKVDPAPVVELWRSTIESRGTELAADAHDVINLLRLPPEATVRAAVAARLQAAADGGPVTAAHVRMGARTQSAGRLEQLAERIEPGCGFDDLVLPASLLDQVRQVAERGRHRDRVLDEWGMGGPGSRGRGITALFAGDSGTGKTLSAEAIAGELGVDLYVIDLSTVVDKYIGETEKNLGRVFDEAEGINGILFFDEADALFGKRSETSDAKDRYANVEVAYLLQRMERFDGVAILATNLRSNIDEAFTRRLDVIVHFTVPDAAHRRLLWERHLPQSLPRTGELDLGFLADRFEISGGVIRNVALTAAYRAAQADRGVTMGDFVRAAATEFTKMGRLFDIESLGPYASELSDS